MTLDEKAEAQEFVNELVKATVNGDVVWDVDLFGDARQPARRYTSGCILANGAVGCLLLQSEQLLFLNSHEYRPPDVSIAELWRTVQDHAPSIVRLATDGLKQRMNEPERGGEIDLNEAAGGM